MCARPLSATNSEAGQGEEFGMIALGGFIPLLGAIWWLLRFGSPRLGCEDCKLSWTRSELKRIAARSES